MATKVIITGATGFVGSNLCRRLIKEQSEVHVIARSSSNFYCLNDVKDELSINIHDGSMESMFGIISKVKPDIIYHLAALVISEHKIEEFMPLLESNVIFGMQLVEAAVQNNCFNFINTGTFWQHFNNMGYSPVNLYAATKQAFEDLMQYYVDARGLNVITLVLYDTYGPNDPRPKLFTLLKKVSENQETMKMTPGEQLIDLVHVNDVIEAYIIAADRLLKNKSSGHEHYTVNSCRPIRLKDLIKVYQDVTGRKLNIDWGGRAYRLREIMVPWNNGTRLPGWEPEVDISEGIKQV